MPQWQPKSFEPTYQPKSFLADDQDTSDQKEEFKPTSFEAEPYKPKSFLETAKDTAVSIAKKASDFADEHPKLRAFGQRLLSGQSSEDIAASRQKMLDSASPEDKKAMLTREMTSGRSIGQIADEGAVLPKLKHSLDEGTFTNLAKGAYNNLVVPMTSPSAVLGSMRPGTAGAIGDIASEIKPEIKPEVKPELPAVEPPVEVPKAQAKLPDIEPIKQQAIPEFDTAKPKTLAENQPQTKPLDLATPNAGSGSAVPIGSGSKEGASNLSESINPSSPTDPKSAVKQWADGRAASTYRAKLASEKFADLTDPSLVDKFEQGDRTGQLKELEDYFAERHKQGVEAGLFKQDQHILNYIRHEFKNPEDQVEMAMKNYIAKNPSIAKTRRFPTYAAAEGAKDSNGVNLGLQRKYDTIPEIVHAYEKKFQQALKNKEYYDYLQQTKQIKPGQLLSNQPDNWTFTGPNATKLKDLTRNVLDRSKGILNVAGDAASVSKNITLAGGIPYTKYNAHAYNLARNDVAANGYKVGLKRLFTDPTGSKAEAWTKNLPDTEKQLLAELMDHGWQGNPMPDSGHTVNLFEKGANAVDNKLGKGALSVVGKGLDKIQKIWEEPLFKRSLPAMNIDTTLRAFHKLEPVMDRKEALKAAADIGNHFSGAVDTVLRDPTNKDLGRIAFLAPHWLESQVSKAIQQWKSVGKVMKGEAGPVDKYYAKSLARSATLPATSLGIGAITGKALLSDKTRDIGSFDLGKDDIGKVRQLPSMSTADEGLRAVTTAPIQMYMGNPAALKDLLIKNKISTPAKTIYNLVNGQDSFGSPLANKDKFGQEIPFKEGLANYAAEATKPFQHQAVQALIGYLQGKISREEAIAQGLELPLTYSNK